MFRNYFLAALRNARKFRIHAAINILGLSVALAGGLALAVALLTISLNTGGPLTIACMTLGDIVSSRAADSANVPILHVWKK